MLSCACTHACVCVSLCVLVGWCMWIGEYRGVKLKNVKKWYHRRGKRIIFLVRSSFLGNTVSKGQGFTSSNTTSKDHHRAHPQPRSRYKRTKEQNLRQDRKRRDWGGEGRGGKNNVKNKGCKAFFVLCLLFLHKSKWNITVLIQKGGHVKKKKKQIFFIY